MKGSPVIIKASKKTHKYRTSTSKSFKKLSRGYQRCVWPPQLKKTRKRQTTYKTITSDIAYFSQPTKPQRRSHEDWWHPTTEEEDDLLSQGNPWSPSIASEHVDSPCKCSARHNFHITTVDPLCPVEGIPLCPCRSSSRFLQLKIRGLENTYLLLSVSACRGPQIIATRRQIKMTLANVNAPTSGFSEGLKVITKAKAPKTGNKFPR